MSKANERQTSQNLQASFPQPYKWDSQQIAIERHAFLSVSFNKTTLYVVSQRATSLSLCAIQDVTARHKTLDQVVRKMENFTWCTTIFPGIENLIYFDPPMIIGSKVILVDHLEGAAACVDTSDKPVVTWNISVPVSDWGNAHPSIVWEKAGLFFVTYSEKLHTFHTCLYSYSSQTGNLKWVVNFTELTNKMFDYNDTSTKDELPNIGGFAVLNNTLVVTVSRNFNSLNVVFLFYLSASGDILYNVTSVTSAATRVSGPAISANGTIFFVDSYSINVVESNDHRFTLALPSLQQAPLQLQIAIDEVYNTLWVVTNKESGSSMSLTRFSNTTHNSDIIYQCFLCGFTTVAVDNTGSAYFCINDFEIHCYVSPILTPKNIGSIGTVSFRASQIALANHLLIIPNAHTLLVGYPTAEDSKHHKKYNKTIIIASSVTIGSLLLACLTFICVAFYIGGVRGKKKRKMAEDEKPLLLWLEETREQGKTLEENRIENCKKISDLIQKEDWYIPLEEIKIKPNQGKLGGGAGGNVYGVKWKGIEVALKTMIAGFWGSIDDFYDFSKEISLLSSIRHPNIVLFLGVTVEPSFGIGIVTEYCPRGSLLDFIQEDEPNVTWNIIMKISTGTALAMAHLHSCSPPIIHRDIKPGNIVLLEDYTAKICDFGISCIVDEIIDSSSGTPLWCAPEVKQGGTITRKVDVYSYGLTLWSLLTRRPPTNDTMSFITLRPEIPEWCPESYAQLISWCWAEEPDDRPTFWQILKQLQKKCITDIDNLPSSLLDPYIEKIQNITHKTKHNTHTEVVNEQEALYPPHVVVQEWSRTTKNVVSGGHWSRTASRMSKTSPDVCSKPKIQKEKEKERESSDKQKVITNLINRDNSIN
eukprot:CAMPEP_0174275814 /NCGR_PEP_ID=MMETSP0439-20130205/60044_1 /TAXON_ID=0 /ORGANISM="Stereomyxa ramosa, Strain Chinc5" /LENGTH=871 /DNA_ID=CAMNT_0015367977 /DNA_START=51 /DNA_END=2666 /DNA_ORIENTATION=-